jgi:hypothetical protein
VSFDEQTIEGAEGVIISGDESESPMKEVVMTEKQVGDKIA